MSFADALVAQRDAQAAYTAQLAAFSSEEPDLEQIALLGVAAENALARSAMPSSAFSDAERSALLNEARHTAELLDHSRAAALAHMDRLAGEVTNSERTGEALRAYLPATGQPPPRYLDERR